MARKKKPIRLSLCMIVRDSSRTLRPCLESIREWVDELVVVDTGSTDDTPQIAAEYGARVFHFPWIDDFSAARNESISHARGEWLFWMDSDDTISADNAKKLRQLADGPHEKSNLGYVMQVHCPGDDDPEDVTVVDHVKLFRNMPELFFECRIHEQLLPAIRKMGGQVGWTDIFVTHSGSDHSLEGRKKKQDRDLRLLKLELNDRPDHPFALFNLGMTYADMNRYEEAVESLVRCLEVAGPAESQVRKAYALLVNSYAQLKQHDTAWDYCKKGRALYPQDPELLFRQGMLEHHFGRLEEAVRSYQAAIKDRDDRHFSSIDRGIVGFKARHNLAVVYIEMNRLDLAELQWRTALDEMPRFRPAWHGLGDCLVQQNRLHTADVSAEAMLQIAGLMGEAMMLKAKVAQLRGEVKAAREYLEDARRQCPDDVELLRTWCQFVFENGLLAEALSAHLELTERQPDDASAHHNLASVYMRLGENESAVKSYKKSVDLRPHSISTLVQLGNALKSLRRHDEAQEVWLTAKRLEPDNPEVQQLVDHPPSWYAKSSSIDA